MQTMINIQFTESTPVWFFTSVVVINTQFVRTLKQLHLFSYIYSFVCMYTWLLLIAHIYVVTLVISHFIVFHCMGTVNSNIMWCWSSLTFCYWTLRRYVIQRKLKNSIFTVLQWNNFHVYLSINNLRLYSLIGALQNIWYDIKVECPMTKFAGVAA